MNPYLDSALILFFFAILWYAAALVKKDNSLADIAWGLGFILIVWWVQFNYGHSLTLCWMVTLWGLRLSLHIGKRNLSNGEDWRYLKWRSEWGRWFYFRSFLQVFLLQASLLWVIALPLMQVETQAGFTSFGNWLGIILWLFGFVYESVADWQLASFKKLDKNQGEIMRTGLWKYSRHPNYFGEITVWWGIFLFVLDYSALLSWDTLLLLASPMTITFLLLKISGIPMLEAKYKDNPEYLEYVESTNRLIPRMKN